MITEPLDDEGRPDFIAFLNERFSQSVSADRNMFAAALPLLREPTIEPAIWTSLSEILGGTDIPENTPRFVSASEYAENRLGDARDIAFPDQLSVYDESDYSDLASWLAENEDALNSFVRISSLDRFYYPLVAFSDEESMVTFSPYSGIELLRQVAIALVWRAMGRCGDDDWQGAMTDLLAAHRIGFLMSQQEQTLIFLAAKRTKEFATQGDLVMMTHAGIPWEKLSEYSKLVNATRIEVDTRVVIDQSERLGMIENTIALAEGRVSLSDLTGLAGSEQRRGEIRSIDWNVTLEELNRQFDRYTIEIDRPTPVERLRADSELSSEFAEQLDDESELLARLAVVFSKRSRSRLLALNLWDLYCQVLSVILYADVEIRLEQDLLQVAFAYQVFALETGEPSETLGALVPTYIDTIPQDSFAENAPIRWIRKADSVRLYSIGMNEVDDGGVEFRFRPNADIVLKFSTNGH